MLLVCGVNTSVGKIKRSLEINATMQLLKNFPGKCVNNGTYTYFDEKMTCTVYVRLLKGYPQHGVVEVGIK